jgi:hypothetical protein
MSKKALAVVLVLALFFSAAVVLHANNSASYLASASSSAGWKQTYGGDGWDQVWSVIQTSDGGYALAGGTESFGSGGYEFWLVKTDSLGNVEWNETYGAGSALSIVQTSDGGYALAGTNRIIIDDDLAGYYAWLIKTDPEGIIPEFPSWIILPLVLITTVVALFFKSRSVIRGQRENIGG